jgi:hypothetical protein
MIQAAWIGQSGVYSLASSTLLLLISSCLALEELVSLIGYGASSPRENSSESMCKVIVAFRSQDANAVKIMTIA